MISKIESESPPPPEVMEVNLPASVDLKRERPPKEDIQNKLNKFCSVCQVGNVEPAIIVNLLTSGELREQEDVHRTLSNGARNEV